MDARRIIRALWFTPGIKGRWGIPILVSGPPGSAKTTTFENVADACGLARVTLIGSVREPADFLGLPIPDSEGGTRYAAPSWAKEMVGAARGVVLGDEFNTSPVAVQAAQLRMVLEGFVGELELPKTIRFALMQNPVEQSAGGSDLSMPMANRVLHWTWDPPTEDEWSEAILGGAFDAATQAGFDPEAEEARVMRAWSGPWAKARGIVAAFVRKRRCLSVIPKSGDPAASGAYPTPRSWEMAARVLAGAEVHGLSPSETHTLVQGCVGPGHAAEFVAYVTENDLPEPADLLDGRATWQPDNRLDRTMAVYNSCAALVVDDQGRAAAEGDQQQKRGKVGKREAGGRFAKLCELMLLSREHIDVVVPAAMMLVGKSFGGAKEFEPVLDAIKPIFKATGKIK